MGKREGTKGLEIVPEYLPETYTSPGSLAS